MALLVSVFAALVAFHHAAARYLHTLGRERFLPTTVASVGAGAAAGAPVGGSVVQSMTGLLVIVTVAASGADPVGVLFVGASTLAAIGLLTLMVTACLAAAALHRVSTPAGRTQLSGTRDQDRRDRYGRTPATGTRPAGWAVPLLAALGLGAVLAAVVTNLHSLLGVPPRSPVTWLLPAAVAAVAAAGLARGMWLRRNTPEAYQRLGRGRPDPLTVLDPDLAQVQV